MTRRVRNFTVFNHPGLHSEDEKVASINLEDIDRGFLPNRLTTVQRDAIPTPPAGLTIYNTTTNRLETFDGSQWERQDSDALIAANNLSDLASAGTARTNLGLVAVAASGSATDLTTGTLPNARLVAVPNSALANSSITIAGHTVALGGNQTLTAADLSNGVTGTGSIVLSSSPSLTTPNLGAASVTSVNGWSPSFCVRWDNAGTAPASAGAGYAVGDTVTLPNSVVLVVLVVSGGAITKYRVQQQGSATTLPANPVAQVSTSGAGSGATFNLTWAPLAANLGFDGASIDPNESTLLGANAGIAMTTGIENTIIGFNAGALLTTGGENVIIGWQAYPSGNGTGVVAIGNASQLVNTGGGSVSVGTDALKFYISNQASTAIGGNAGKNLVAGGNNVFVGNACGMNWTANSGTYNTNTAVGDTSFRGVANGSISQISGNVAVGWQAMLGASAASGMKNNVAVGANCLVGLTNGAANVAIGLNTGNSITGGGSNVVIGQNVATTTLTTGSNNVLIGTSNSLDAAASSTSNTIALAAGSTACLLVSGCGTPTTSIAKFSGTVGSVSTIVSSLPSASSAGAGARAFVTDATATTFLSTVVGSGSNKVPVVSDGTNWLIG